MRDPVLAGNKARKLHHNLLVATEGGARTLVSMGGPHSNHLHAMAQAGRLFGFETAAYIRAEPDGELTPTLADCAAAGMRLLPVSRSVFRQLRAEPTPDLSAFSKPFWLPEGGSNALAVRGLAETLQHEGVRAFAPDVVLTAAGTGATAAGLALGLAASQHHGEVWAVAVLKGGGFLRQESRKLISALGSPPRRPLRWLTAFHFGGYGRCPEPLQQFCREFSQQTGVPVEPVYTGRVCYALCALAGQGLFRPGSRVLFVHTGGLQGARSSLPAVL